jgi:hypothetical protein
LQFLLPALLEGYAITIAILDTQPNLTVYEKLTALQNCKDILQTVRATDEVLAAKQSTVPKSENSTKCKFCKQKPHTCYEQCNRHSGMASTQLNG